MKQTTNDALHEQELEQLRLKEALHPHVKVFVNLFYELMAINEYLLPHVEDGLKLLQKGFRFNDKKIFGDERRRSLIWLRGHDYDSRTNAKLLDVVLHAFYAKDVASNFALHRQGVLNLIGKPTDEKLDLLSLLGIQDKRKPFNIYTITLLEKLSLKEEYKKNKSRAKKKIKDAIDAMLSCKMILQQPDTKKNSKGEIIEYTFYLNPNYTKEE